MEGLIIPLVVVVLVIIAVASMMGLVIISERQVGIIVKRFSSKPLPPDRLLALNGEAGYQAETLAPGVHFGYFPWKFSIRKVNVTVVPSGEIALIVAADGDSIPAQRILGKYVDCDDFQDARKFLLNGGEKGRQLGILTAGAYRINTALFTIITRQNATQHDMEADDLMIYRVDSDQVGIVTTLDGAPIDEGEIAGLYVPGHENFQNAQAFLEAGGRRGLQEQVLLSGSWNLNPWFVKVEQVPMTEIPIGYVGVVISYVGKAHIDVSGTEFKHGDLVNVGHKGVWVTPLYPGKHPLNTHVMKVELVPTTNIVLNWSPRTESHSYDSTLNSITVNSADGFTFDLDVAQIIHVGALEAPKVISRIGSVQNMVDHVLQPIVSNYFRNAAQSYTVLDFLHARSERQGEATVHVSKAIRAYDVEAIDTLIGKIVPPPALMQTLTDRKIAEEQNKTYQVQKEAQTQRQELVRATAQAEIQQEVVKSEQGVNIAELQAKSQIKQAEGEAESIRLKAQGEAEAVRAIGEAKAAAYHAGAEAMGQQGFTAVQLMQIVGDQRIRIIPDIAVNGGGGSGAQSGNGIVEALIGVMLRDQMAAKANGNGAPTNGNTPIKIEKE
ncbi:MAG: SPFH domain-containing protein [Chloroflexota bacterium]